MSFDAETMVNSIKAGFNIILDNDEYLSAVASVASSITTNMGDNSVKLSVSDIKTAIEDLSNNMTDEYEDDAKLLLTIHANKSGSIAGMNLNYDESGDGTGNGSIMGFVYSPEAGYEFWTLNRTDSFSEGLSEESVHLFGEINSGSSGLSGNMYVKYGEVFTDTPEWNEENTIKVCDFENLKLGQFNGVSVPNVKLTTDLWQLLKGLEDAGQIYNLEKYEFYKNSSVVFEISGEDKALRTNFAFNTSGIDLGLSATAETGGVNVEEPDDTVSVSMTDVFSGNLTQIIDTEKLKDNAYKVYDNLESTGINVDWLNDILEQIFNVI